MSRHLFGPNLVKDGGMTKRQIIDEIIESNPTAGPAFLAQFDHVDLLNYLRHLQVLKAPRLTANTGRYERHFPPPALQAADELSVLSPLPRAATHECPAAAASPTSVSVVAREATSPAWTDDLDLDFDENSPSDPRADTTEFEPIVIAEPADDEPASAPQHEPAEQTVVAADDGDRITYESDNLVAVHAEHDAFDDDHESWLF